MRNVRAEAPWVLNSLPTQYKQEKKIIFSALCYAVLDFKVTDRLSIDWNQLIPSKAGWLPKEYLSAKELPSLCICSPPNWNVNNCKGVPFSSVQGYLFLHDSIANTKLVTRCYLKDGGITTVWGMAEPTSSFNSCFLSKASILKLYTISTTGLTRKPNLMITCSY